MDSLEARQEADYQKRVDGLRECSDYDLNDMLLEGMNLSKEQKIQLIVEHDWDLEEKAKWKEYNQALFGRINTDSLFESMADICKNYNVNQFFGKVKATKKEE